MIRRPRPFPIEELLLAHLSPGFVLAVGWTVMYEVYHEEGSYYSTLMQEILSTEGLFPYFLISAILMAFPLGFILDTVRQAAGEAWLGLSNPPGEKTGRDACLEWLTRLGADAALSGRYLLYRHARATVLAPAKAAGNMALVLLIFLAWFVVKVVRIQGWTVFSAAFIIGTPLVGVALIAALLLRYVTGFREFLRLRGELLGGAGAPGPGGASPAHQAGADTPIVPA